MTGCQGLLCVRFAGQTSCETILPMEERRTFEVEQLRLFVEPVLNEEAYALDHWLDLNA